MLIVTKKIPQCICCEGTIRHGPSFKNFAMPNDPEKHEIPKVVKDMAVFGIPRKFVWSPKNSSLFAKKNAKRINTVGTASTQGSEI